MSLVTTATAELLAANGVYCIQLLTTRLGNLVRSQTVGKRELSCTDIVDIVDFSSLFSFRNSLDAMDVAVLTDV